MNNNHTALPKQSGWSSSIPLSVRKNKFTVRVNTGAGAQRGCGVSSLEILKPQLGKALSNLLYLDLLWAKVGQEASRGSAKPTCPDDLTLIGP